MIKITKESIKDLLRKIGLYDFAKSIIRYRELKISKESWINFFSKFIKKGDLVFDIVANVGAMTEIFLKNGAIVVAVELLDSCIKILKHKFGREERVILIEKGIDRKPGEKKFYICNLRYPSTFSKEWIDIVKKDSPNTEYQKSKIISMITLDMLIKKYGIPVFYKIDVKGFKFQVLKGLSCTI